MPLRSDIKKVLVIGSGPIVIGQAAEFDYAGTQACRALKQEGLEVVLVNSNPATIMTDKHMADKIYIEPLTLDCVKRIIRIEKPDSILSTLGGQTGLTLSMQLAEEGFLTENNVKLLGANPETIHKAEDRQAFKDTMEEIGEPCIPSKVVETVEDAMAFAEVIKYPVIVRPAFTLGGTGGGIANDPEELHEIATNGLRLSPITQILVEKCISGWKEIEFEVIRDAKGNVITVCSMENFDPVGVHTGDSIVVAPAVTLSDKEYQMLRTAALNIIQALKVEGGCNCQFALHPTSFEYAVIEVNPRVSRSSALASKATGYPIAKVATRIAIGYSLDEIVNQVTGKTYACFEPAIDYLVVKFPKWPFDKFVYAKKTLGTQMKATGEIMAIGSSFEAAMMKAVRSIELGLDTMTKPQFTRLTDAEVERKLYDVDVDRSFCIFEALKRGISTEKIHEITMVDCWFIDKLKNLADLEKWLAEGELTQEKYDTAKKYCYLDRSIEKISGQVLDERGIKRKTAVYKMVDTCAAEFSADTPYFYSTFDEENEAAEFIAQHPTDKKKIIVFGSGPIRIGQGIEFDYCSVHCVWALKEMGYEAIICNNNPETVSTDFDTGDRLYFDPLTFEDVDALLATEKPYGVVVQFGGQTAIKLTKHLQEVGARILGTSAESIDAAEDRELFDELLERCGIPRPSGETVFTTEEALKTAEKLGYPVLLRPSYVLGGQNMIIAHCDSDVVEYMDIITQTKLENPVLIDKYLMGTEVEVDAICDGTDFLIPGIMEHIERAGVHSGDSISVYPARTLSERTRRTIVSYTERLAKALNVIGLVNIQYVVYNDEVYVIEVNPRSSRTVPYISKVTGVQMVDVATKIMLGQSLKEQGFESGLYPEGKYVAVKVPVFSFEKLHDVDTQLGPEMKSTGECLGIAQTFHEALYKGLIAAGFKMFNKGGVLFSVRNADKPEIIELASRFEKLGFEIYATSGTASMLNRNMIATNFTYRVNEGQEPNIISLLESGKINYVISTSETGRKPARESVKLRRKSVERSIACLTSIDTANALISCIEMNESIDGVEMVDITTI
ncbi:MAG: carbamoyl-phosphate synthase large subunit [Bacteroides sp.]|nr:carbamoyl-phosphate synthase large subunit [Eubacterium sp.]MCM1417189.1 carbamoyl-phosphate synthase large subunit [Roseburia sp.]MCM1461190.1 carbamoyl-phosphate synthase large subunit [Bacteroides sp.]